MVHHNQGEIKAIVQALLAIFISYTMLRFLAVFAQNFHFISAIGVIIGIAIIYFSFRRSREFDMFIALTCLMAIPFSILFFLTF